MNIEALTTAVSGFVICALLGVVGFFVSRTLAGLEKGQDRLEKGQERQHAVSEANMGKINYFGEKFNTAFDEVSKRTGEIESKVAVLQDRIARGGNGGGRGGGRPSP